MSSSGCRVGWRSRLSHPHLKESGIPAVYDRHSYDAKKRKALVQWAGKLETILGRDAEAGARGHGGGAPSRRRSQAL